MFPGPKWILYLSVFLFAAFATLAAQDCSHSRSADQQISDNNAKGPGYQVQVRSVMNRSSGATVVRDISYTYSFDGHSSVFISGLGLAPASGTFTYLTSQPCLEFRASERGEVLASVRLKPTAVAMGSDSVDVPEQSSLNGPFRELTWTPVTTFPEFARDLFDKYFPLGYETRDANNTHYSVSTFHTLQTSNMQIVSQIAIALSQPYGLNGKSVLYHMQFVIRDRPRLSSTFRYGNDVASETSTAAQAFLSEVVREAKAPGGQK